MTTARMTRTEAPEAIEPDGLTITDYLSPSRWPGSLRARDLSPKTVTLYTAQLVNLENWLDEQGMPTDVALVRREHLEAYLVHLREHGGRDGTGAKATSVSIAYRSWSPFWKWLVAEDIIRVSPMAKMRPPIVKVEARPFPQGDMLQALLDSTKGSTFADRRDRAIVLLLLDTGIRRGELVNMTTADLDVAQGKVSVYGKERRHRWVPISPAVAMALDKYMRVRKAHPQARLEALWVGPKGALSGNGVLQMFRRRGAAIGFHNLGPHQLRHAFADAALRNGAQEGDIMKVGGWKDATMLRRYGASQAAERALLSHASWSPVGRMK